MMQFRDLKTQYNVLKDEMDKAILDVVASSAFVMGQRLRHGPENQGDGNSFRRLRWRKALRGLQ